MKVLKIKVYGCKISLKNSKNYILKVKWKDETIESPHYNAENRVDERDF